MMSSTLFMRLKMQWEKNRSFSLDRVYWAKINLFTFKSNFLLKIGKAGKLRKELKLTYFQYLTLYKMAVFNFLEMAGDLYFKVNVNVGCVWNDFMQ